MVLSFEEYKFNNSMVTVFNHVLIFDKVIFTLKFDIDIMWDSHIIILSNKFSCPDYYHLIFIDTTININNHYRELWVTCAT